MHDLIKMTKKIVWRRYGYLEYKGKKQRYNSQSGKVICGGGFTYPNNVGATK